MRTHKTASPTTSENPRVSHSGKPEPRRPQLSALSRRQLPAGFTIKVGGRCELGPLRRSWRKGDKYALTNCDKPSVAMIAEVQICADCMELIKGIVADAEQEASRPTKRPPTTTYLRLEASV